MKGLYVVGVFQSLYGILQYIGKYPSNHNSFAVTGSFDNPAGFIAVLSLLFPIGIFWCIKSKRLEQRLVFFSVGLILFSIIISGSRTGLLAVIISTISNFIIELQLLSKFKHSKCFKLIVFSTIILLLASLSILYVWKPDSANGRLLIWNVSTEMIKDKPLTGFGYEGFQANYMSYQAQYFKENPHSRFKQLADNVTHPFNEFIKIAVNYGVIGLSLYVLLISIVFWKLFKSKHPQKNILIGMFVSFITISFFSYPLQYAPIWLLLSYLTLVAFPVRLYEKNLPLTIRIPIIGICFLGIILFSFRMNCELEWKDIAVKSLQGHTKQMLPKYEKLYPYLKYNSLFLYNYGAELNVAIQFEKSKILLNECRKKFNDYDLQMLLADNYYHIGDTIEAIRIYQHAENMIPCRFLPLYCQFEIYKKHKNVSNAKEIAHKIVKKQVKVKSTTVESIIENADNYLNKNEKEKE
ncbi:MAG: O-antigen ligase family protein [Bacteroidales bacterium]|nr:O-antigen ligase family protein [Bacteroidales bacterium]